MSNVDELVAFLRARLDEDEQVARRACEYAEAEWRLDEEFGETVLWWPPEPHVAENERRHGLPVVSDQWRGQTIASGGERIAPHVARHDPARILAEVEAKRGMLKLHGPREQYRDGCTVCDDSNDSCGCISGPCQYPCTTLRLLTLPYAGHDDYDESWKP